jgi:hypothetical protein
LAFILDKSSLAITSNSKLLFSSIIVALQFLPLVKEKQYATEFNIFCVTSLISSLKSPCEDEAREFLIIC